MSDEMPDDAAKLFKQKNDVKYGATIEITDTSLFAEVDHDGRIRCHHWIDMNFGDEQMWDFIEVVNNPDAPGNPTLKIQFHLHDALDFLIDSHASNDGTTIDPRSKPVFDAFRNDLQAMLAEIEALHFWSAAPQPPAE